MELYNNKFVSCYRNTKFHICTYHSSNDYNDTVVLHCYWENTRRMIMTNSNLSTQPSENSVFSRLFACVILKPYVFSLVFALMSENKGNFLLFAADYLIQQPCGSTLRFPCSVSVDIHCGTDISVSEKLLHILWGSPI